MKGGKEERRKGGKEEREPGQQADQKLTRPLWQTRPCRWGLSSSEGCAKYPACSQRSASKADSRRASCAGWRTAEASHRFATIAEPSDDRVPLCTPFIRYCIVLIEKLIHV